MSRECLAATSPHGKNPSSQNVNPTYVSSVPSKLPQILQFPLQILLLEGRLSNRYQRYLLSLLSLLSLSSNFCTFCCLEHPSPDIHVVHSLSLPVLCRTATLGWKCFKPSRIKYTCTNDSLSYLLYFPLFLLFSVCYFLYLFQLECKIQEIRDFLFGSIFIFYLVSFVLFCLLYN